MKKAVIAFLVIGIVGAGGYGVYHHFFEMQRRSVSLPQARMRSMLIRYR